MLDSVAAGETGANEKNIKVGLVGQVQKISVHRRLFSFCMTQKKVIDKKCAALRKVTMATHEVYSLHHTFL